MRFIVFIELSGLYLRALGLSDQVAVVHDGNRLIDVSKSARQRKVTLERSLQEAKLLLQGGAMFVPYRAEEFEAAAARWLDLLAYYSGTIEPLTPSRALVDLSDHPQAQDIAALLLSALHRQEHLPLRAGIAPAPWLAMLAARFCDPQALALELLPVEPVTHPADWLAEQSIASLKPLPADIRQRLERLGLRKVKELQQLPEAALRQQFRLNAPWIRAVANGRHSEPVAAAWPRNSLSLGSALDRCEDTELLDRTLVSLAQQAAAKLSGCDRVAGEVSFAVTLESGGVLCQTRRFKHPLQTALWLLTHLRQLVAEFDLTEPVVYIRLRLLNLAASPRKQTALVETRRDVAGAESAIHRLQDALGSGAIMKASALKQSREQLVLKAWKAAYDWV